MRLLVVTNDYPPKPGGIQQYLANLVDAYEGPVEVAAPADRSAGDDHGVHRGPRRFMWPTPGVSAWLDGVVQRFEPNVVLFGAPYPLPWLGAALRTKYSVPYAVLGHGAEVTIPAAFPVARQLLASPLRRADGVMAVSEFTAAKLRRLTGNPVAVIGGGVDTAVFHPTDLRPTSSRPVVGCVSRFVPRKGQHLVIEAVAELRKEGVDAEVMLVGRGRTEDRLRARAIELGVPLRMEVDVPWSELGALYRQMDVFCMPCRSRWGGLEPEGLGLVFLEAAATGLPVLAGASGGAPETVDAGRTGFVVRSVADITEALGLLLADPDRARRMGELGRERVAAEFTWQRVGQRLRVELERIVGEAAAGG